MQTVQPQRLCADLNVNRVMELVDDYCQALLRSTECGGAVEAKRARIQGYLILARMPPQDRPASLMREVGWVPPDEPQPYDLAGCDGWSCAEHRRGCTLIGIEHAEHRCYWCMTLV